MRRARADAELLARAARPLSAAPADVPALVEQQQARLVELERERKRLAGELAMYEAQSRWDSATVDVAGVRRIHLAATTPVKDAEPLVQQLLARGACVVLVTNEELGSVMLAASPDSGVDAGQALRAALQAAGGRGGGSPRVAQGAVASPSALPVLTAALGF